MPPAYRNPTNDPPRIGEMIHVVRSSREFPGIVNAVYADALHAFIMNSQSDPQTEYLRFDEYDPTETPVKYSWHFDHYR